MKKTHTTPYHPQGNAGPERFNRTLLDMLGPLWFSHKQHWKKYISSLVFAYNSTPHEATRVAPFELMFGRNPKLPIGTVFEISRQYSSISKNTQEYITSLKERMEKSREVVRKHVENRRNIMIEK